MWWMLLLIPIATVVLLAIPLGIATTLGGWTPSLPFFIGVWAVLTTAVVVWSLRRDPELLTWTLTNSDLRRGKREPRVMFSFQDIETIVVGVPSRFPVRAASIFVRLRGGRRIPLNFVTGQFIDGHSLMKQFIQLNAGKIVGPETFTRQELRKMRRADLNQIFVL
jgi:hypothetical protein